MCGRYTLTRPGDVLEETADALGSELGSEPGSDRLGVLAGPGASEGIRELLSRPRYNVAPSERMPVVLRPPDGGGPPRPVVAAAAWGLPARAAQRPPLINARSETAATLATFADSFAHRRCLVPADGFYEWRARQPYRFVVDGGRGFCFAGLWIGSGDDLRYCILTTAANATVAPIHDRMPVMLRGLELAQWLAPGAARGELEALCRPRAAAEVSCYPVGSKVNRAGIEGPDLVAEVAPPAENLTLF